MIKKIVLAVGLLFVATNLWAAWVPGPSNISNTIHNMGSQSPFSFYRATNEDEVCIFCHTPHGGTLNTPLWNRALPNQSVGNEFTHYTSASLSSYLTGAGMATRQVNAESLLCMSCHDGTVAMNSIINASNRTGAVPDGGTIGKLQTYYDWGIEGIGAVIGDAPNAAGFGQGRSRDLRDDHPISFSYDSAKASTNGSKLNPLQTAKDVGVRFFGVNNNVECSSCHDPHVNGNANTAYLPFLITPNTASALCLACHIK